MAETFVVHSKPALDCISEESCPCGCNLSDQIFSVNKAEASAKQATTFRSLFESMTGRIGASLNITKPLADKIQRPHQLCGEFIHAILCRQCRYYSTLVDLKAFEDDRGNLKYANTIVLAIPRCLAYVQWSSSSGRH